MTRPLTKISALFAMFSGVCGSAAALEVSTFEKIMNDLAAHTMRDGGGSSAAQQLDYGDGVRVLRICSEKTCFILAKSDGKATRPSVTWTEVEPMARRLFGAQLKQPNVVNTTKEGVPGYAMTNCASGLSIAISPIQQAGDTPLKDMLVLQMTALDASEADVCKSEKAN